MCQNYLNSFLFSFYTFLWIFRFFFPISPAPFFELVKMFLFWENDRSIFIVGKIILKQIFFILLYLYTIWLFITKINIRALKYVFGVLSNWFLFLYHSRKKLLSDFTGRIFDDSVNNRANLNPLNPLTPVIETLPP